MESQIRTFIGKFANITQDADSISVDADLFLHGMSSFSAVQLMMALEEHFDVEFPDERMHKETFRSIAAIRSNLDRLLL